jgi:hypothetical protein
MRITNARPGAFVNLLMVKPTLISPLQIRTLKLSSNKNLPKDSEELSNAVLRSFGRFISQNLEKVTAASLRPERYRAERERRPLPDVLEPKSTLPHNN